MNKYKIINTTDGKFLGHSLDHEPEIGEELMLDDFKFEIESKIVYGKILKIANSNYVALLEKVE